MTTYIVTRTVGTTTTRIKYRNVRDAVKAQSKALHGATYVTLSRGTE